MSSGPSERNEKPRSAWSSCGELTPRSKSTPESGASPGVSITDDKAENGDRISVIRSPNETRRGPGGLEGHRVAVEANDAQRRVSLEKRLRMSASADGGVDERSGWHRGKERHHFVAQHGSVGERVGHLQPLGR